MAGSPPGAPALEAIVGVSAPVGVGAASEGAAVTAGALAGLPEAATLMFAIISWSQQGEQGGERERGPAGVGRGGGQNAAKHGTRRSP